MSDVGLMFVGAALFVNGLVLLGRLEGSSVAALNLFVGALQTAIPFYLIATAKTTDAILLDSGIFMFGFTYLYVGLNSLTGHSPTGLGWYSAWVAVMALVFGLTNFVKFHDPTMGLLWLQWSVLWCLFFVVLGLGVERLQQVAAWYTVILAFTTATIPGYVMLLGDWGHVHPWLVLLVIAATVLALVPAILRAARPQRGAPAASTASKPADRRLGVTVS